MPKTSSVAINSALRNRVFDMLNLSSDFQKINDRQYGMLLKDEEGNERYVRIGVIVAEEREDVTARELMQSEIDSYNEKQAAKAEKALERAEKAERDKAKREKAKKEDTEEE